MVHKKLLKFYIQGGLGHNTLYLDSSPRTLLYSSVSRKPAIVMDESFQCIKFHDCWNNG